MRTGNGDVGFQPHQLGQHLGPAHHGQLAPPRLFQLRIARPDGGRHHDDGGLAQIFRPLPLKDRSPQPHQPVGDFRGFRV
jgi:hypothetical protein